MVNCINCNENTHIMNNCPNPIYSYGLIVYTKDIISNKLMYLIIQRKDSIGYTDFIKGKYNLLDSDVYMNYIYEMSNQEIYKMKTKSFDYLWNDIFINKHSRFYKTKYYYCKMKFNNIMKLKLFENVVSKYNTNEYGFPKGRKQNIYENNINCAIREFCEETGFSKNSIKIHKNIIPFKESYISINNKKYIHIYYLAEYTEESTIISPINYSKYNQGGEIKSIEWCSFEEVYFKKFRDYHYIKKGLLYIVNKYLTENLLKPN